MWTVPLSIIYLLINLIGFPSIYKAFNYIKPKIVGIVLILLFDIFKCCKLGILK